MDIRKAFKDLGSNLNKAKDRSFKLAMKEAKTTFPKTGTGVHGPSSFGVNANTQPATMRMAGGVGLQKVATSLIHIGLNEYALPAINKAMKTVANDVKEGLAKGVTKKVKGGY